MSEPKLPEVPGAPLFVRVDPPSSILSDFELKRLKYFANKARDNTYVYLGKGDGEMFKKLIQALENLP